MLDINLLALLRLQENDMRCRDLETRLTTLPKELDSLIAQRDQLNSGIADAVAKVKQEELFIRKIENEVAKLNDENSKLQKQSSLVKKNNEYQAMLQAIAQNKSRIDSLEEQLLFQFDQLEQTKKVAVSVKRENETKMRSIRQEFEELLEFSKTVKEEIAKLRSERPALIKGIPNEKLQRYERLLRGKNSYAPIVKVENGTCGCCHMKVTMQTINQLRKGEFISCDNCQHLIYTDEADDGE